MDIPKREDTTSFLRHTERQRRILPTENLLQIRWSHPNKGEIVETLCHKHARVVADALGILGIGCTGYDCEGVCLRCVYGDDSITTWMPQWI
jgi:hypothetical protein